MAIDLNAENRRLREEIEELKEEKRQREESACIIGMYFPPEWKLSKSQSVVLTELMARPGYVATQNQLLNALKKYDCGTKYTGVLISQIRLRAKIDIKYVWGVGYQIPHDSAQALKKQISDRRAAMEAAIKSYLGASK